MIKPLSLIVTLALIGCAGNPHQVGLYTPVPREEVYQVLQGKVVELGYTVTSTDRAMGLIVAERSDVRALAEEKEELRIRVVPDLTGVTRIEVTAARILPGTPERPSRRVAARSRTASDALALLEIYMKTAR